MTSVPSPLAIPPERILYRTWRRAVLFGVAFVLLAEAGRFLSVPDSTYISFWLPAGLYVAALLVSKRRAWPWLVLAAVAGNLAFDLAHGTNLVVALLFCLANSVQSVGGAWLVRRFVAERPTLATVKEFVGFLGFAAVLSTAAGATIGAATLAAFGLSESFLQSWKVWWGSNAMAILLLSPFILTWFSVARADYRRFAQPTRLLEAALLLLLLIALIWHLLFMGQGIMAPDKGRMVLPLLWAGLRFGPFGAAAASLLLAVLIAFFTTQFFTGLTPDQVSSGEYVFVMQFSLAVAALVALIPAIVMDERDRKMLELREREERLRQLSRHLIEVEEVERRNINRELHDRIGQNLSALNLSLEIIRGQLPGNSLPAVRTRLDDAQVLLEATLKQVRNVMADLRPIALDDYGLIAALRTYTADFANRFELAVTVNGRDSVPRLSIATETAVFRIAQEALNNIAKHARARKVEITLAETPRQFSLTIADDGIGYDTGRQQQEKPTYGMTTMRERAEAIGASLTVNTTPGRGTRVTVSIERART